MAIFLGIALCSVWGMKILELLLDGLGAVCAGFADARRGEVDYTMADTGLSAFSLFFMQSESFLAHQRRLERGHGSSNCHTLFGMRKISTDNYIRLMLDKVSPRHLRLHPLPLMEQPHDDPGVRQGAPHLEPLVETGRPGRGRSAPPRHPRCGSRLRPS